MKPPFHDYPRSRFPGVEQNAAEGEALYLGPRSPTARGRRSRDWTCNRCGNRYNC